MTVQIVRPAGAGHETIVVFGACVLILALAAAVVSVWSVAEHTEGVAEHQVDARRDLNAAEQGIYADLRVARDELAPDDAADAPAVQALAEQGLPPFAQDVSSVQRGGHAWTLVADGDARAYVGLTADPAVAGSLLLRLPPAGAADHAGHDDGSQFDEPDVWLHRTEASAPARLDDEALARGGWRQIAARFDAGVTRQHRH